MDQEIENKQKTQSLWQGIKDGIFNVFVEMLKNRKVSTLNASFFKVVMFLQLYGTVIRSNPNINWVDDICDDSMYQFFNFVRVIPAITSAQSTAFFWFVYSVGIIYFQCYIYLACVLILEILGIFTYLVYCMVKKRQYGGWALTILKTSLTYFCYVCFSPIVECFISIEICDKNSNQINDSSIVCYSGVHIFLIVFSLILLLFAIGILVLISVLYQKTQPMSEDALAQ